MSVSDQLKSRFIVDTDNRIDHMIYDLPKDWWSRPYEYAWCASFASEEKVVLDAACGVCHPFKFYLSQHCKKVYACDLDPRITSTSHILDDIRVNVGEAGVAAAAPYISPSPKLSYAFANLIALPYVDDSFDLVYCVSVLEHLPSPDRATALKEFSRTLKPQGMLILTVDYPTVDLEELPVQLQAAGFKFAGEVDYERPENVVHSTMWGPDLSIFRLALVKGD